MRLKALKYAGTSIKIGQTRDLRNYWISVFDLRVNKRKLDSCTKYLSIKFSKKKT